MKRKIRAGIVGATGLVGQNYIRLLANHPWFEINYLAASTRSAGKPYREAVAQRWLMPQPIPPQVETLLVQDAADTNTAAHHCELLFSAVELPPAETRLLENAYAAQGLAVVSNNSAHRSSEDVPVIIPEINSQHLAIIEQQRAKYAWGKGLLVVKPNCSVQSYLLPIHALNAAGHAVESLFVTTLQAISGAGYPGPAGLEMIDNIIPYIPGEEEKSETEPLKIFGELKDGKIQPASYPRISAHCNRVPVIDGHTACISLKFSRIAPPADDIIAIWRNYRSLPQQLKLPFAPDPPMIYHDEQNRPQPQKDRELSGGMTISLGRLRPCNLFDYRFVGLSHNTVRGAAGGAILIAELLVSQGFLD